MHQVYGLQQLQVQKLIMTQSLQQAIAILQMPANELWGYVNEAVLENPVLEWSSLQHQGYDLHALARAARFENADRFRTSGLGRKDDAAAFAVACETTLGSALREQLGYLRISPRVRGIVDYMIDCLDERGYLTCDLDVIQEGLGVAREQVDEAFRILIAFEPKGIGARSLQECLLLQLDERGDSPEVELARHIVANHLEELGGKPSRLLVRLGCSKELWNSAMADIRALDPRPGYRYSSQVAPTIVPDMTVVRVGGDLVVLVNDWAFPAVQMAAEYQSIVDASDGVDARDYLTKKMSAAYGLLRSIEARRRTLYRVTEVVVQYQRDFFEFGLEHLKPLTLRTVADLLHLHESTISRAVAGKFVDTPRGIFELRYFFSAALGTATGEVASAKSVQAAIKRLLEQEDKRNPLSDQEIAQALRTRGIHISRRTVAKYREDLRIPSSAARKQSD